MKRQPVGQQAALQCLDEQPTVGVALRMVNRKGHPLGSERQQLEVTLAEAVLVERPEQQQAHQFARGKQRHHQQALQLPIEASLGALVMVEVAGPKDRTGKRCSEVSEHALGDAHRLAARQLRRQRSGTRPHVQSRELLVAQQQRGPLGTEELGAAPGQCAGQLVEVEVRHCSIRENLQGPYRLCHRLCLRARTRFAHALGPLAVQLHKHANLGAQNLRLERLHDVVHRTRFVCLRDFRELARLRRHEDDRDVAGPRARADDPGRLQTVHPGHAHVQQDHRALGVQQRAKRLLPGFGQRHWLAERL